MMPEVPRDPRQLARDILSGKISIEELAREQQRQRAARAGGAVPPVQQPRVPQPPPQARVPLPRPVPPPAQRPVMRPPPPPPPRPVQRPTQGFPQSFPQQRRQVPVPQRGVPQRGPQIQRAPVPQQLVRPASQPTAVQPAPGTAYAAPSAIQDARAPIPLVRIRARDLTKSRALLRQAVVMSEILGKPLALREDW